MEVKKVWIIQETIEKITRSLRELDDLVHAQARFIDRKVSAAMQVIHRKDAV